MCADYYLVDDITGAGRRAMSVKYDTQCVQIPFINLILKFSFKILITNV